VHRFSCSLGVISQSGRRHQYGAINSTELSR
jgi:hypothetical protein